MDLDQAIIRLVQENFELKDQLAKSNQAQAMLMTRYDGDDILQLTREAMDDSQALVEEKAAVKKELKKLHNDHQEVLNEINETREFIFKRLGALTDCDPRSNCAAEVIEEASRRLEDYNKKKPQRAN